MFIELLSISAIRNFGELFVSNSKGSIKSVTLNN